MRPCKDQASCCQRAKPWAAACLAIVAAVLSSILVGCSPTPRNAGVAAGDKAAAKYEHQLVRRPGDTPEDSKVYIVMDGQKRWVAHADWIRAHGYQWPGDVHQIPASDLEAIPTGPPITEEK
jgi:hypothetical protein